MTPLKPLNISLLELTPSSLADVKQIRSLNTFQDYTKNFTPDGLFSTEIFGRVGDINRNYRFGFIDLNIEVLHPVIYRALTDLKNFHEGIFSSEEFAVYDSKLKEFVKSNPVDGNTGYHFFISHLDKLSFAIKDTDSNKRKETLKLINKYKQTALMSKLLVLPAGLRDYELDKEGKPTEGEVNSLYRRVLSLSNQVVTSSLKQNPELQDKLRYAIQQSVNDIYDYFESLLKGKSKLIQGKVVSRNVQLSTRNVLTGTKNEMVDLDEVKLDSRYVTYGLYQFLKATLPLSINLIRNDWLSKNFKGFNTPITVTDAKTLKAKTISFDHNYYDKYMSEKGLEKIISSFGIDGYRAKPVMIGEDYAGLVLIKDGTFRFIQCISEVNPEDVKLLRPITLGELLYKAVYKKAREVPVTVTRYPVESVGSIFVALTDLKSTDVGVKLKELDESLQVIDKTNEYPLITNTQDGYDAQYYSGIAISVSHLKGLSADSDGDTLSVIPLLSTESINEINQRLNTVEHYVYDSSLIHSYDTGIISQLVSRLST